MKSIVVKTIAHVFFEEATKGKNPYDATKGFGTSRQLKQGRELGKEALKLHLIEQGITDKDVNQTLNRLGI